MVPELKSFLEYLKTGEATDQFTRNLDNEVSKIKSNEDWRVEYMTLLMRDNEMRAEGEEKLATLIQKMIQDGESDLIDSVVSNPSEREKFYKKYDM